MLCLPPHREKSASDRGGSGQHLDGSAGGAGLGHPVPFGQLGDELLDLVEGAAAGLDERAESEERGGRAVARCGPVRPDSGAGQAPFHEHVERAGDLMRGQRSGEGGGFAVRPVDEQSVDGVLLGAETEQGEQGDVRQGRGGVSPPGRTWFVVQLSGLPSESG
ncbi:hypothetical protein SNE510_27400 [Streptomyces sp. NE5-10]|nr:hypothetical protein SNE510_27400 [Streptomyces sp. NE5-10]